MKKSVFLSNIHHAYAQTDGSYKFPNSFEGDAIKAAKTEIESLTSELETIKNKTENIVAYTGATDDQVRWGSNDDPRPHLEVGHLYRIKEAFVHSWHTKYELEEFPGLHFNSVSFEKWI